MSSSYMGSNNYPYSASASDDALVDPTSHPHAYSIASESFYNPPTSVYNAASTPRAHHTQQYREGNSFDSTPRGVATFDPDSPFNSSIVPVRTATPDGRFKTRLMGLSGDFLTSPMFFGNENNKRISSLSSDESNPGGTRSSSSAVRFDTNSMDSGSGYLNLGSGMGIGLSDFGGDGGETFEDPVANFGVPARVRDGTTGEISFATSSSSAPYQPPPSYPPPPVPSAASTAHSAPSTPAKKGPKAMVREVLSAGSKFIEHRFPKSPPLQQPSRMNARPKTPTLKKEPKVKKSVKQTKSCSDLRQRPPSRQQQGAPPPVPLVEPLTPSSSHSQQQPYFVTTGVPYNSPVNAAMSHDEAAMPFSISQLVGMGLSIDSAHPLDPRKSPFQFANDLLASENNVTSAFMVTGTSGGAFYGDDGQDFSQFYQIPTPVLAHGSTFSSPSSAYFSDNSPDAHLSPQAFSSSMYPGHSIESTLSFPVSTNSASSSTVMAPGSSRQACVDYNNRGVVIPEGVDPALLSPRRTEQLVYPPSSQHYQPLISPHHVPLSLLPPPPHAVNNRASTNYSYPSRYAPPHTNNVVMNGEIVQQGRPYQIHQPHVHASALSPGQWPDHSTYPQPQPDSNTPYYVDSVANPRGAQGGNRRDGRGDVRDPDEIFDNNLVGFDEDYAIYVASHNVEEERLNEGSNPKLNRKRSRADLTDDDEEDEEGEEEYRNFRAGTVGTNTTDDGSDYVPSGGVTPRDYDSIVPITSTEGGGAASKSARKRLRTVASAPCLTLSPPGASLVPRRMKPGPKPRSSKSPQESDCQGIFRATISPPPLPPLPYDRQGSIPFDDSYSSVSGIRSSETPVETGISKELILSMYQDVPAHMGADGIKVPKMYVCRLEGCGKLFPRKSAVESHIQTHMHDKPYQCNASNCGAEFVRLHDLRRHERIHSQEKPFKCRCLKGFARGDALTRHRQRNICIGGFEVNGSPPPPPRRRVSSSNDYGA